VAAGRSKKDYTSIQVTIEFKEWLRAQCSKGQSYQAKLEELLNVDIG